MEKMCLSGGVRESGVNGCVFVSACLSFQPAVRCKDPSVKLGKIKVYLCK